MGFEIVTESKYKCSRCAYTTYSENAMRTHILDKLCAHGAQYYTGAQSRAA